MMETELLQSAFINGKRQDQVTKPLSLANHYIELATSDNTRRAYRSDIRHYEAWGGKLPATTDMIAEYLHTHAESLNPRTLARRLIALKHWHIYQNFSDPTQHPAIKKTLTGITRARGKPKVKAKPLTPHDLSRIHEFLKNKTTLAAIRDDALLQIGYFGALRRSELAAIRYENITWEQSGIGILIPSSKTDQEHQGQICAIPYGTKSLCPIRALDHWLKASGINEGWIFRRIYRNQEIGLNKLTDLAINLIVKKCAQAVGLSETTLSSHSLRRGLATSAARAGVALTAIMRAGRWKQTNTVIEYIEEHERFSENAASSVLQNFEDPIE